VRVRLHNWKTAWPSFTEFLCPLSMVVAPSFSDGVAILLPVLFTVYVNNVIMALSASGYGCYFHGMFVGSFVYADDLLLFPHHCVICS